MNIRKQVKNQKGFTLIEIIVSLVLVGIIGVFAGMGLVSIVEGFIFTKMNAETAQKGQAAMTRLVKEFNFISSVTSGTDTSINFTSYKAGVAGTHVLVLVVDGNNLVFDSDILTDDVSAFELAYYDSYNGTKQSTWSSSRKIIEITLTLRGASDIDSVFTSRVVPRNL